MLPAFFAQPVAALWESLGSTPQGLSSAEAERRLAMHGPNDPTALRRLPKWRKFLSRFTNPLVMVLLIASGLSAVLGDVTSFIVVTVMVIMSVTLDFIQEVRAENTVEALRKSVALHSSVWRDGTLCDKPTADLVPGDLVQVKAGDLVPADARVVAARTLFVNQALLTGESYPVEKRPSDSGETIISATDALSAVFAGTSVVSGEATLLICQTGQATQFGDIAGRLLTRAQPTEFDLGIRRFGWLILQFTMFLVLFVLVVNVIFHRPWLESLMFALALAVGLTPELLPMIVTITLARGAIRLTERRVVVKQLEALHNLGAMDVLCTDKTGTLTQAKVALVRHLDIREIDNDTVFELAYLNSFFETGLKSVLDEAILTHRQLDVSLWRKLDELPFDFERRRVSVLVERSNERRLIVKGAPESILALADQVMDTDGQSKPLDEVTRKNIIEQFNTLSAQGFRSLGIGWKDVEPERQTARMDDEADLIFAGFAVFLDPPKPDAGDAIRDLSKAGVSIKLLTGDDERVTRHVCSELGLTLQGVMTGDELAGMSEEALLGRLATTDAFCRVNPQQKQRVILALKRSGHTVGFLGDGINDAPALHASDVGISVELAADVAKQAAALVLLERDLGVLRETIMEGRRTVLNVTKYVLMGASSNFGNMFSMAGAALFLPFLPMKPAQVLLNNLLYDTSELGVPFDEVDKERMARPIRWDLKVIRRAIFILGPASSLFDFLTFYVLLFVFKAHESLFQTGWFIESLATQCLVIFAIRTWRPAWKSKLGFITALFSIVAVAVGCLLPLTPLAEPLGFVHPPLMLYFFVAAAVIPYLLLVEFLKRFLR